MIPFHHNRSLIGGPNGTRTHISSLQDYRSTFDHYRPVIGAPGEIRTLVEQLRSLLHHPLCYGCK